ncbi:MAG TPA: hypothetical protein VMQ76_03830 [Terracidiphilus sp.]|nr:hypothetical protein [Terracidiphilus sp.]
MATAALGYQGTTAIDNSEVGEAQRLFAQEARAKYEELMETGQVEPFTVVNFNPVEIGLQGLLKQYKVPSPSDVRLPPDVSRIRLPYDGKDRVGHLWTCRFPKIYGGMIGAKGVGNPGEVVPQQQVKYLLPIAIAYSFLEHFSPLFMAPAGVVLPPTPKDARRIYGLLVFKGDVHTLERELAKEDPAKQIIEVPIAHYRMIGKEALKTYRTTKVNLQEYIERMFAGQKRFADATISRAQQRWSEDQSIREISENDRVWYRWAIHLGYAPQPKSGEKSWLNQMLSLTGAETEAKADSRLRKCQSCKKLEPEPDTPFCSCGSPVNTFTTYMAGYPMADAWLMSLRGEEREVALAERKLRLQGFEEQGPENSSQEPEKPEESPAGHTRGSYKKSRRAKIDPNEEIPAAETTALPGEE